MAKNKVSQAQHKITVLKSRNRKHQQEIDFYLFRIDESQFKILELKKLIEDNEQTIMELNEIVEGNL